MFRSYTRFVAYERNLPRPFETALLSRSGEAAAATSRFPGKDLATIVPDQTFGLVLPRGEILDTFLAASETPGIASLIVRTSGGGRAVPGSGELSRLDCHRARRGLM
jgi:hypothetical protein